MRLLVDKNIPFASEVFAVFGEVRHAAGREIFPSMLKDIDILLVRSVTRVNEALLKDSPVGFVGTATIGTDHIDLSCLAGRGIVFASAAGSNANSVAEYVAASLMLLEKEKGCSFEGKTMGIIGVGNVGSRVRNKALALGMKVLLNDPPREEREGTGEFTPLEALLEQSDVITVHTPLTRSGPHATYHLIGAKELARMNNQAVFFNTSRGATTDGKALLEFARKGHAGALALDVWENEPDPAADLMRIVDIGTPHIAGYSFDGKIAGARMMAEAAARYLKVEYAWNNGIGAEHTVPPIQALPGGREALREMILQAYPIQEDSARMRALLDLPEAQRPEGFDHLRKDYPVRREFANWRIRNSAVLSAENKQILGALGFQLE